MIDFAKNTLPFWREKLRIYSTFIVFDGYLLTYDKAYIRWLIFILATERDIAWLDWCILRRDVARILNIPYFRNKTQIWSRHPLCLLLIDDHFMPSWSIDQGGFDYASTVANPGETTEILWSIRKPNEFSRQNCVFTPLLLCGPQKAPQELILVSFCRHACLVWELAAAIRHIIGVLRNICSTEKVCFSRCQKCFVFV